MSRTMAVVMGGVLALTGCAGARTHVVVASAEMPVSMSRAVRDADGVIVAADRREIVGHFDEDRTAWGMLYSAVKLTPEKDISSALNEQVKRAGGDAVVNVSIATRQCGLNWFPVLNLLPFWPGCANVHVEGDIIRVRPATSALALAQKPATRIPEPTEALTRRTP